jgi:hypothetical protein
MTDQELRDLVASLAISHQKTEQSIRELSEETRRFVRETEKAIKELKEDTKALKKDTKELKQQIGGLANKFGSFTEGLALPSMTKILSEQFGMTTIHPSVRIRDKSGNVWEIDVLAYANGELNTAYIVEVKSHLRDEGIEQILRELRNFPAWFPELADKKLYGILAVVDASPQLRQKVLDQGLYFARIHDEQFSLCVPEDFQPRCFTPPPTDSGQSAGIAPDFR